MKSRTLGLRVAGTIFGVIALLHIGRLLTGFDAVVAGWPVPLWMNGLVSAVTGALCVWLWRLSGRSDG